MNMRGPSLFWNGDLVNNEAIAQAAKKCLRREEETFIKIKFIELLKYAPEVNFRSCDY